MDSEPDAQTDTAHTDAAHTDNADRPVDPAVHQPVVQVLPSMRDLDQLTADLDAIDSTLAELDAR